MTDCKPEQYQFHALGSREVVGHFDGGDITTDARGLLLREVEKGTGIVRKFAACFTDYRDVRFIEHTREALDQLRDACSLWCLRARSYPPRNIRGCLKWRVVSLSRESSPSGAAA